MNTATTIQIKTDIKTKNDAKKIAEKFGFNLTSLVNAFLKQIVRTRRLTVDMDEIPNQRAIAELKKSEEDVKAGRVISFDSPQEAVDYVRSMISHDKKHTSSKRR